MKTANLPKVGATRRDTSWGQAYSLTEGIPSKDPLDLIAWLDVENKVRWRPIPGTTYCNVYAHDYCVSRDVYLPRVWWTPGALVMLGEGKDVPPVYGKTVIELSANGLFRWLAVWSEMFGWRRLSSVTEAQTAANDGEIVVLCARRKAEGAPGHISCIVPESAACRAVRENDIGEVVLPVQSQAGGRNVKLGTLGSAWWLNPEMAEWGVWACPQPVG